ncbi:MAG: iron ABC transporter permease [Zoogloeaceae bacterium]|jgi:iron complex transport system permease protein|nr:iron ABC transporter permease [Zoogloeaceae bacterium]
MKRFTFRHYALMMSVGLAIIWLCLGVGLGGWQRPDRIPVEIWDLRWPRVAAALMVGGALTCAGAALQALFMNPLADPSLIGTSSGAALGVVMVLALGGGGLGLPLAAFLGALAVCVLVLALYRIFGGGRLGLLLIGFVISAFCGAVVSLILFLSNDMVLRSATTWLMGSFSSAGWTPLHHALIVMVAGGLLLLARGRDLDCLLLGEETSRSLGVDVRRARMLTIAGAALLTGAAVSISGVIGFIGMIIPNLLATLWGGGRTQIMIRSALVGSVFLLVVDTLARYLAYPVDLPVGVIIALIGAPFFLWLFLQGGRNRMTQDE